MYREGFISYQHNKNPLSNVILKPYSPNKQVLKIYDNLYLDQTNFNLIEVNGDTYNKGEEIIGENDDTGSTISNIWIVEPCNSRTCNSVSVAGTNNTDFKLSETKLPILTTPWSYISQTPDTITDTHQIFFIPISSINTTIVYVINLTVMKSLMALKIQNQIEDSYFISDLPFKDLKPPILDNDSNNGNNVIEPFYDSEQQVYQITSLIKYDYTSQKLLVKSVNSNKLSIYDYSKNVSVSTTNVQKGTYTKSSVSNNFSPWSLIDENNNLVVFMPVNGEYTLILVLYLVGNQFKLGKSITFNKNSGVKIIDGILADSPTDTKPVPLTDAEAKCYLDRYGDLQKAYGTNLENVKNHWITYGYKEGRNKSCDSVAPPISTTGPTTGPTTGSTTGPTTGSGTSSTTGSTTGSGTGTCSNSSSGNTPTTTNSTLTSTSTPKTLTDAESRCYLNRYPDLSSEFKNDLVAANNHWVNNGFKEGRDSTCHLFDIKDQIYSYYNNEKPKYNMDDYILKTQMVPPVSCANCICSDSSCSNDKNCGKCGGNTNGVAINTPTMTPYIDISGNTKTTDSSMNTIKTTSSSTTQLNGYNDYFKDINSIFNSTPTPAPTLAPTPTPTPTLNPALKTATTNTTNTNPSMFSGTATSTSTSKNNQRNQYFGNINQEAKVINQFGGQSGQSSIFIPITSDFSKFSK
jgi:hypothetical protein